MTAKCVPPKVAAAMMEKGLMFVCMGLRNQRFPFGTATLGENGKRWSYHISPGAFAQYLGISRVVVEQAVRRYRDTGSLPCGGDNDACD